MRAPCQICWLYGVVPHWRARQLENEKTRQERPASAAEDADVDDPPRGPGTGPEKTRSDVHRTADPRARLCRSAWESFRLAA